MEKTHRLRVVIVAFLSVLVFASIEIRLYIVQIVRHRQYAELARAQQRKTTILNRRRGDLLDRHGQILATSTFYDTVYFNPKLLKDLEKPALAKGETDAQGIADRTAAKLLDKLALRLGEILQIPVERARQILSRDKVTLVARKIPPEISDAIRLVEDQLHLPEGLLFFEKESKRLYPQGDLAGPIIGYTMIDATGDNIGKEGLEREYNLELAGQNTKQKVAVNSWRQGLAPLDEQLILATFGNDVQMTLDSQIQLYAQKAIRKRVGQVQALDGGVIIMDVRTGAILAMAGCPDFDPNKFSTASAAQRRNRLLTDPFEIGSVMKILTATILIDNKLLRADELVDCQGGRGLVDGRQFTDSHKIGVVPFREAFAVSSNIAAAKLGLRLEPNLYYSSLQRFGLGRRLGIDLPGENLGVLRPVSTWTRLTRTSLPVGYETQMTPLQVVTALSAIGNGGIRLKPRIVERVVAADGRIVKEFPITEVAQVCSPDTSKIMLDLMEGVVRGGTGESARIPGYTVAGKTGTTKKPPYHEKHYIASFAGLLPASNPRVAMYVYINEPNPRIEFYGGKVSAPVFAEIAEHVVRILGIPPDKPEELIARTPQQVRAGPQAASRLIAMSEETVDGTSEEELELTAKAAALAGRDLALAGSVEPGPPESAEQAPDPESDARPLPARTGPVSVARVPNPEAVLARIRERIQAEQAAREVAPGVMPLCVGLTMSEVVDLMAKAGVNISLQGTGIAIRQSPMAGNKLEPGQKGEVLFALPSDRVSGRIKDFESAHSIPEEPGAEPEG